MLLLNFLTLISDVDWFNFSNSKLEFNISKLHTSLILHLIEILKFNANIEKDIKGCYIKLTFFELIFNEDSSERK